MDFKTSKKERRIYNGTLVSTLKDNVFDLYPVYADSPIYAEMDVIVDGKSVIGEDRRTIIMDAEVLCDEKEEILDRAMFAAIKQRGSDPTDPDSGVQWAEAVIGEVMVPVLIQQVEKSVFEEGINVMVTPVTTRSSGREYLTFQLETKNIGEENLL